MRNDALKTKAYRILKQRIMECQYKPGEFLNETRLSEEIGVSRTPIRDALASLEREKLVRIFPKKGIMVTDITIRDIIEIYQVLELLEPYIINNFSKDIDKEKLLRILRELRAQGDDDNDVHNYQIDSDLHQVIISANANHYFTVALDNVYAQNHRVRIMTAHSIKNRIAITRCEHLRIVEAMLVEDYASATSAMVAHLRSSKEAAIYSMLQ